MNDPTGWTPTDEMVEWAYASAAFTNAGEDPRAVFRRWLRGRLADAWDEGHQRRRRRGPDCCLCEAWDEGECGCGEYGTGQLVSLGDNPYRSMT